MPEDQQSKYDPFIQDVEPSDVLEKRLVNEQITLDLLDKAIQRAQDDNTCAHAYPFELQAMRNEIGTLSANLSG